MSLCCENMKISKSAGLRDCKIGLRCLLVSSESPASFNFILVCTSRVFHVVAILLCAIEDLR
jgi:hypothetical protein